MLFYRGSCPGKFLAWGRYPYLFPWDRHFERCHLRGSSRDTYGYADKHWGRSYNQPWLQFASGHLISEKTGRELKHSALAIDGCCPKFLFFPMRRRILMQLTYTGEDFEYHFGRPLTLSRCKWKVKETQQTFYSGISKPRTALPLYGSPEAAAKSR